MYKRKIPTENILYMLSYVMDEVDSNDNLIFLGADDDFNSIDIWTKLFLLNFDIILKKGIYREYIENNDELKGIKGKLDIKNSIIKSSFQNAKAICNYDELTSNNRINQIVKTIAKKLMLCSIRDDYRYRLRKALNYLNDVDVIKIKDYDFNINFNKNNKYMKTMIMICKIINDGIMLSENEGNYAFEDIFDNEDKMSYFFELFIYKFYDYELSNKFRKIRKQMQIGWNLSGGNVSLIPVMRLDTYLEDDNRSIIIDTKYKRFYSERKFKNNNNEFGISKTYVSENLYQMFTYITQIETNKNIIGILLYPVTNNLEEIDETYNLKNFYKENCENSLLKIYTINLNNPWRRVKDDLIKLVS